MAGVALGVIYLRLAWQAWHLETSTCVWRGRRGTGCTWCRAWSPLVALGRRWWPRAPRHFAWQAWHLETSTCVWSGRCGTWRHLVYLRLAWQAWHIGEAGAATLSYHISFSHQLTHTTLSHTIFHTPSHSHNFDLSHTIFLTHNFVTGHLSHNTIFHTPSHPHKFVTHHLSHTQLCHTLSFSRHLSHTTLSLTIFLTPSFTHHFVTHHL